MHLPSNSDLTSEIILVSFKTYFSLNLFYDEFMKAGGAGGGHALSWWLVWLSIEAQYKINDKINYKIPPVQQQQGPEALKPPSINKHNKNSAGDCAGL